MNKYFKKSLQEYDQKFLEGIVNQEAAQNFVQTAKALALSEEQIQGIWEWIILGAAQFVEQLNGTSSQYCAETEKALRSAYGNEFDSRLQGARGLVQKYGDENLAVFLKKSGIGNCREIIDFLMRLAEATGEDRGLVGEKAGVVSSDEKIKAEIARLMAIPAYMQAQHPEHDSTVQQVYGLRKRLFGEG